MIKSLSDEMKNYLKDMEEIVSSEEELKKVKKRTSEFFDVIIDNLEEVLTIKLEEIRKIEQIQRKTIERTEELEQKVDNIYEDIYGEFEDFDIVCPYCNYEFNADIDESNDDIVCPECHNIIELDWNGDSDDSDDGNNFGCNGDCPHCK